MKKLLIFCSLLMIIASACRKDSEDDYAAQQAAIDEEQIKAYMTTNKINGTRDPSGLYYAVLTPGTGAYPTNSSTVNVNYTGSFTDGTVFESGNYTTSLGANGNVIEGWKIGIPKINTNGRILLMIPSALAYGPQGSGRIAANKVIVFQIDLLKIQ